MKPELRRFGSSQSPVVVVDGFSGGVGPIVDLAAAMAPFAPGSGTYYPGLREKIGERDPAWAYVSRTLQEAAPFIGGGFDADGFELLEASFSMVTAPPASLVPAQRAPHFDSTDRNYLAILHYLSVPSASGTAFFRQRATGIEVIDTANVDRFVAAARRESVGLAGYVQGSNEAFEEIGRVEAVPDRLLIYRGSLLHSGIIPPDMVLSPDPRRGRLTANLFILAR